MKQTALVTGATSGIGRSVSFQLAERGAKVIMLCRDKIKAEEVSGWIIGETGNEDIHVILGDLSSLLQVRRMADYIEKNFPGLNILINNAGIISTVEQKSRDGYELTFAVNHLSHFMLTYLVIDTLTANAPARIINISSDAHRSAKDWKPEVAGGYDGRAAYARSKLANVLFTYDLASRVRTDGINVLCVHPGAVATAMEAMTGDLLGRTIRLVSGFLLSPERAAEPIVDLALKDDFEDVTGKYFVRSRMRRSSKVSYDEELASSLWEESLRMCEPFLPEKQPDVLLSG